MYLSELPTISSELPTKINQLAENPLSELTRKFRWGSELPTTLKELPTPTENVGLSAQVCAKCLSRVISISVKHFCISRPSFRIPLNSTVFSKLKFKIEIHKRSSKELKHRLLSKYSVVKCSFSFQ